MIKNRNIKDNEKIICDTEKVNNFIKMDLYMKDIEKDIQQIVMVDLYIQTEMFILANEKIIKHMVKVNIIIKMELYMMEIE